MLHRLLKGFWLVTTAHMCVSEWELCAVSSSRILISIPPAFLGLYVDLREITRDVGSHWMDGFVRGVC